jgi:prevent-host-death family protein
VLFVTSFEIPDLPTGCAIRWISIAPNRANDYNDLYDPFLREVPVPKSQWTVAEAKAKFSEVLEKAVSRGPQAITRHGQLTAVIVSAEEWERKTRRAGNLAEFFAASPLRDSAQQLERAKDAPREIDL